jgi:glycolate oxidase
MPYNKITPEIIKEITAIVGKEAVMVNRTELEKYSHDETEDLSYYPEVAVKPKSAQEIAQLLKLCNRRLIPVTPRGGGTGLTGGALPIAGGLLISMELFNHIIEIDEQSMQATVGPGVITEVFMNAVAAKGMFYPIDPSSKGSCFLGGNVANGSGGPRVVKYGTIREYILNLEVVLPSGDIIWTGANTLKFASGYNLTQLMIGSEGTLGIVTKIVTKLIPLPASNVLLMAAFSSNEDACAAVSAIFRAGIVPSAVEYMERNCIEWVKAYSGIHFELKESDAAFLLIEVDGNDNEVIFAQCEKINLVLEEFGCKDTLFADTATQKAELWRIRRTIGESVKQHGVYKKEDTVVPRSLLPQLVKGVKQVGEKYGFESVCFGHAGDGNMHINIIKGRMSDDDWNNKLNDAIREIFKITVALGGAISGEHGIGLVQKEFLTVRYDDIHFELLRGIKKVFDKNNILNPGKIFE